MKTKIIKGVLPPLLGIATLLGILFILKFVFFPDGIISPKDYKFLLYFVPLTIVAAILIQFTLTLPFWERFKENKKILGIKLIPFTCLIILISGIAFGFLFFETGSGRGEFIASHLTGIIAFAIYWSINLITLVRLDKMKIPEFEIR